MDQDSAPQQSQRSALSLTLDGGVVGFKTGAAILEVCAGSHRTSDSWEPVRS